MAATVALTSMAFLSESNGVRNERCSSHTPYGTNGVSSSECRPPLTLKTGADEAFETPALDSRSPCEGPAQRGGHRRGSPGDPPVGGSERRVDATRRGRPGYRTRLALCLRRRPRRPRRGDVRPY